MLHQKYCKGKERNDTTLAYLLIISTALSKLLITLMHQLHHVVKANLFIVSNVCACTLLQTDCSTCIVFMQLIYLTVSSAEIYMVECNPVQDCTTLSLGKSLNSLRSEFKKVLELAHVDLTASNSSLFSAAHSRDILCCHKPFVLASALEALHVPETLFR